MVKSYDIDLRSKLISYLLKGNSYDQASKVFGVSSSSIGRWMRRYKSEGNFLPRKNKAKLARVSEESFSIYVSDNPDKTLEQIGKYFGMGRTGAHYYMNKFGFSVKKKSQNIKKRTKKSEKNI